MVKCCVSGCKISATTGITYFKFPASRKQRRRWEEIIKLYAGKVEGDSVCSRHFRTTDYQEVRGKTRLKAAVVPTVFTIKIKKNNTTSDDDRTPEKENTEEKGKSPDNDDPSEIVADPDIQKISDIEQSTEKVLESVKKSKSDKEQSPHNEKSHNEDNLSENQDSIHNGNKDDATSLIREETAEQRMKNRRKGTTKKHLSPDKETSNINGNLDSGTSKDQNTAKENLPSTNLESLKPEKGTDSDKYDMTDTKKGTDNDKSDKANDENHSKSISSNSQKSENTQESSEAVKTHKHNRGVKNKKKIRLNSNNKLKPESKELDEHQDIEELLTDYYICQNNIHTIDDDVETVDKVDEPPESIDNEVELPCHVDPVYIELPVDKESAEDCLMVMESVQVEIDPSTVMQDQDFDIEISVDLEEEVEEQTEPISLLTSSDEDDVIIQEPHIDTVEVSDETDEDDMPLVKLVKTKKRKRLSNTVEDNSIVWGMYYCVECHFRTTDRCDYNKHRLEHASPVLIMCQLCGYMTSSEQQLTKHERQHKDFKKYQCTVCSYKAKHKMSLVYHMKSHNVKNSFKCDKCSYKFNEERDALKHIVTCQSDGRKYSCDRCDYRTKKPSDLRRHALRKHRPSVEDDDEYVP